MFPMRNFIKCETSITFFCLSHLINSFSISHLVKSFACLMSFSSRGALCLRWPITCSVRGSMSCHAGRTELRSHFNLQADHVNGDSQSKSSKRFKCCVVAVHSQTSVSVKQEIALTTRFIMCACCLCKFY